MSLGEEAKTEFAINETLQYNAVKPNGVDEQHRLFQMLNCRTLAMQRHMERLEQRITELEGRWRVGF